MAGGIRLTHIAGSGGETMRMLIYTRISRRKYGYACDQKEKKQGERFGAVSTFCIEAMMQDRKRFRGHPIFWAEFLQSIEYKVP